MAEPFDRHDLATTAGRRLKLKAECPHTRDRRINTLNFVELLLAALGLGAAGGTGPKTLNKGLLLLNFFLLALKSTQLGIGQLGFLR